MSLATYADLLAAVPKFLQNRTDLTTLIPDMITLGAIRLNNDLSTVMMETEAPLVATINSRYIDVSSIGINEQRGLYQTTYDPRKEIQYLLPEQMTVATGTTGLPIYWTLDHLSAGPAIAFNRPADQAYTYVLRYIQNWTLSATVATNYLMQNYPSVYLYATLCEFAPYLGNDDLMSKWESKYLMAVQGAQRNMGRLRGSTSVLVVDPALRIRSPYFNIYQGDQ